MLLQRWPETGMWQMVLRGKTDYKAELSTSPIGNMIKLEYEKPFMQEEELDEKVARLNELNIQLDLENASIGDMGLCGGEISGSSKSTELADRYGEKENGRRVG